MNIPSKCVPCEGGVAPLTKEEAQELLVQVSGWELSPDTKSISKKFTFKNFKQALAFTNQVGEIAETQGHHPDIELGWGKVGVTLTTHAIKGLSLNDFTVAYDIKSLMPN